MKISPLLLAALLATSAGAWAQARDGSPAPGERAAAEGSADGRTVGEKARGAAHKAGDATRHAGKAGHRAADRHAKRGAGHMDERRMGAAGSSRETDLSDSGRRQRMDEAYADWKAKQNPKR
ncbi:hypothetical protein PE066_02770 [Ramlibacter tataouinensis]|uniref:hypothetical protein n=1 Tax=Ramlibacter tataouinensis TaxID=94132 RepID=UPI0022F3AC69|nr:hypothetical protein [Ramlibacter tataouinensis]WBY02478.1 hypothetical protein PE066_02770 [Ramlibacter tataouinensis]